jgi:hypothetical protein
MDRFNLTKYLKENILTTYKDNWKLDDKSNTNTMDDSYFRTYDMPPVSALSEADPDWDQVDYDKDSELVKGEFWQMGGARIYDAICKLLDSDFSEEELRIKLNDYIGMSKERHHQ